MNQKKKISIQSLGRHFLPELTYTNCAADVWLKVICGTYSVSLVRMINFRCVYTVSINPCSVINERVHMKCFKETDGQKYYKKIYLPVYLAHRSRIHNLSSSKISKNLTLNAIMSSDREVLRRVVSFRLVLIIRESFLQFLCSLHVINYE